MFKKIQIKSEALKKQSQNFEQTIKELKQINKQRMKETRRYELIINNTDNGVVTYTYSKEFDDFIFTSFNKRAEEIDGIKKENLIGKQVTKLFPGIKEMKGESIKDLSPKIKYKTLIEIFKEVWRNGKPQKQKVALYEDEMKKEYRTNFVYRLDDEEGNPDELCVIYSDITEEINLKQNLKHQKLKYEQLIKTSKLLLITYNLNKRIEFISSNSEALMNFKSKDVEGKLISEVFDPNFMPEYFDAITSCYKTHLPKNIETWIGYQDKKICIESNIYPQFDEKNNFIGIQSYSRNITDKKESELLRERSNKNEQINTLAGGIAHDFNNFLAAILGNLSLAELEIENQENSELSEYIKNAEKACLNATKLTKRLLTLSKDKSKNVETTDLTSILTEISNFALTGSNCKLNTNYTKNLKNINVDRSQFSQVIQNLLINAKQSMPNGGTILLSAKNENPNWLTNGDIDYVKISIKDNGIGIPKENIKKIFNPFFTTKNKGNGLGLTVTKKIIENHEGYIDVTSKQNKGTIFHLYFPSTKNSIKTKFEETYFKPQKNQKILIMDDNPTITKTLKTMLTKIGYKNITTVTNGEDAIKEYKREKKDLLFLDLTIPGGKGGLYVKNEVLKLNQYAQLIVSSGHSDLPKKDYNGFTASLSKPYGFRNLKRVLKEIND